ALPSLTLALNAVALNFFPGTANSSMNARWKLRRLSMVASLPLFVNVAVPQLAMKIAAAQRKTFRDTSVEFIWRSFKSPILRRFGRTCQDLKSEASSGPNPVALA